MLENLRIALKKQRKLILIFLVTVFIPALSLSIFGISAIRNERFRQAQQIESEHRRLAEWLRSRLSAEFRELGSLLENLADGPSFKARDERALADLIRAQLADNHLIETVFYYYENEEPRFPTFYRATPGSSVLPPSIPAEAQIQAILNKAREYEFKARDLRQAINLYRDAGKKTTDKSIQCQVLLDEGRCQVKLKRYKAAIQIFEQVGKAYPELVTASGLPLAPAALIQTIYCYRTLDDAPGALKKGLDLYKDIIEMRWNLSEPQFRTYAGLVEEAIEEILAENPYLSQTGSWSDQFAALKMLLQKKKAGWTVINAIRQEIIPDLRRRQSSPSLVIPIRYSKSLGDKLFLILAVPSFQGPENNPVGLIGIKIQQDSLLDSVVSEAAANNLSTDHTEMVVTDLEGRILRGKQDISSADSTVTEFFDDNFPPWRMEFFWRREGGMAVTGLKSSFYFWTILTLVMVLSFGAVLIAKTITHEIEILKLKSDFVSSVSHEFKTPLTSIKALAERLQGEKSIDPERMKQYYSLISQSADQLTRLVKNLLDFSKIEEGKFEYRFARTDIAELVPRQIEDFERSEIPRTARIHTRIAQDLPPLLVDRDALAQALNNLLDNAFKFSPAGTEIQVSVKKDAGRVVIEVADQGIGISQDEQDKIFEKFYRGKNAVGQSAKGTGLGLTLVKHIAEAHGGTISVRSAVGEGSTFTLALPIRKEQH